MPLNKPWDATKSSLGLTGANTGTLANGTYWFGDAELIKEYNGLGGTIPFPIPGTGDATGTTLYFHYNRQYIVWKNTDLGPGEIPHWLIWQENSSSADTVKEVCSCTVRNSCLRLRPIGGPPDQ